MKLTTIKPRLIALNTNRVPVLEAKAGTTERIRGRAWMTARREALLAGGFACTECGRVSTDHEIDHRIPLEQGGSNDASNLQPLCSGPNGCHARKTALEATQRAGR